jgi:hypothetical protein
MLKEVYTILGFLPYRGFVQPSTNRTTVLVRNFSSFLPMGKNEEERYSLKAEQGKGGTKYGRHQ